MRGVGAGVLLLLSSACPAAFGLALVFFFGLAFAAFLHCFLAVWFVIWLHCLSVGLAPGAGLPPSAASESRIASQLT